LATLAFPLEFFLLNNDKCHSKCCRINNQRLSVAMTKKGTVLIADDEATIRTAIATLLDRDGFQIITAMDGPDAVQKACGGILPDVVVLDVMMPGMNGFDVCRHLKNHPRTASIPVLLLTRLSDREARIKGVESGANDFLTKPPDALDLMLRVRNALNNRRLYDQLQACKERIKTLEAVGNQSAEVIADCLRSPLSRFSALLEYLLNTPRIGLSEEDKDYLRQSHNGARQLRAMANNLLDIGRMEAGTMPINRSLTDLCLLADESARAAAARNPDRQVVANLPAEAVMAQCDSDLIQRVIDNLVQNAIQHTPHGTYVQVAILSEHEAAGIIVQDNGPGIPVEFHRQIFEKYGRFETGARRPGAGLGLAFCKMAVECHGGQIGLTGGPGEGCSFWFTLPFNPPGHVEFQPPA
jgi:signal transduction histidine kinase